MYRAGVHIDEHMCAMVHMWRSEVNLASQLCSSTIGILELEFGSIALPASTFTHRGISVIINLRVITHQSHIYPEVSDNSLEIWDTKILGMNLNTLAKGMICCPSSGSIPFP